MPLEKRYGLQLRAPGNTKPGLQVKPSSTPRGPRVLPGAVPNARVPATTSSTSQPTSKGVGRLGQSVMPSTAAESSMSVQDFAALLDAGPTPDARTRLFGAAPAPGQQRESKYIGALKQAAERRKWAKELATERRMAKQVEAEKEEFGEKEAFVTSAYLAHKKERDAAAAAIAQADAQGEQAAGGTQAVLQSALATRAGTGPAAAALPAQVSQPAAPAVAAASAMPAPAPTPAPALPGRKRGRGGDFAASSSVVIPGSDQRRSAADQSADHSAASHAADPPSSPTQQAPAQPSSLPAESAEASAAARQRRGITVSADRVAAARARALARRNQG